MFWSPPIYNFMQLWNLQVDAFCDLNGNLQVVGYYHANERLNELDLKPAARKIADRIQQRVPQAVTLLVVSLIITTVMSYYPPVTCLKLHLTAQQSMRFPTAGNGALSLQVDNGKLPALAEHISTDILQVTSSSTSNKIWKQHVSRLSTLQLRIKITKLII